jgi:hypothetical protein
MTKLTFLTLLGVFLSAFAGPQFVYADSQLIFPQIAEGGGCTILLLTNQNSGQATAVGFRVNDASCVDNIFCSSRLLRNKGGGTWEAVSGLLQSCGNRSR